jgi:hypothetical protein
MADGWCSPITWNSPHGTPVFPRVSMSTHFRLYAAELLALSARARTPAMARELDALAASFIEAAQTLDAPRQEGTTIILFEDFTARG